MEMTPDNWKKVKALFEAALAKEPSARASYLAQTCPDEVLRQEVEKLLANHQEAGRFLSDPALNFRTPLLRATPAARTPEGSPDVAGVSKQALTPVTSAETQDPLAGCQLGVYRLERRVGQGGMAAVYLAARADGEFRRQVAIKLILPGADRDEVLNRFRRERQTLADLDHPHIVKLLDGGSTPEGTPYLVMDYVEGSPIDEYCDRHRLSVDERLLLFSKVCGGVHYAHQKRVIHRDLKPSNILVTSDGVPKLLDFGIAKVLGPEFPGKAQDTQMGTQCMTRAYASPEQVGCKSVTYATDVYSLGVVLYELLTGRQPYLLKEDTPAELERAISEQEPEAPSRAVSRVKGQTECDDTAITKGPKQPSEGEAEKWRRRLRGDLDAIVLKALRKEPERRYLSVQNLADDIQRHLNQLRVTARPARLGYRASRQLKRHRRKIVAGVPMFLVLIGAVAVTRWEARREASMRRASDQTHRASLGLNTHHTVNAKALEDYLQGQRHLHRYGSGFGDAEAKTALSYFQQAVTEDASFAEPYVAMGDVYEGLMMPQNQTIPLERAAVEKALAIDPDLVEAHVVLGRVKLFFEWDFAGAEKEFKQAIELNPNSAEAHAWFALYLETTGRTDEGRKEAQLAQRLDPLVYVKRLDLLSSDADGGIGFLRNYIRLNPKDGFAHLDLAECYVKKGMEKEHIGELQQVAMLFGYPKSARHVEGAYKAAGYRAALRAWAVELVSNGVNSPAMVAETYMRLGDKDAAFRWLERAYSERDGLLVFLESDPAWDPLRADPRFAALVHRIGLPR
jgi:serine/threonine protein kinase/tetratricopeptide (TPR) repeat protein